MAPAAPPDGRSLVLGDSRTGLIWRPLEWRKIMAGYIRKGTLLSLNNSTKPDAADASTAANRNIPFACIGFSRETASASTESILIEPNPQAAAEPPAFYSFLLCTVDQRGHIYVIDFVQNKFASVARTGVAGVAICFNSLRRREVIVSLSDRSIHCYNIETCQLVARLPVFHQTAAHLIAVHNTRPLAITTSSTEALLWDTETWERKRVLVGSATGVQQVCFSPDGMSIIAAFEDGTIFFWMIDTFALQWQITLDQMIGVAPDAELNAAKLLASHRFSYFSFSYNGEFFAYGGLSSTVYIWNMIERRLLHEIIIPAFHDKLIVQIQFVGQSNVIAILSNSGTLIFIDVVEARFIGQLQGRHKFHSFAISPDGCVLASILLDAKHSARLVRLDPILNPSSEPAQVSPIKSPMLAETKPAPIRPQKREIVIAEQPKTFYELIRSKDESSVLGRRKLSQFLAHYGEYPSQYRQDHHWGLYLFNIIDQMDSLHHYGFALTWHSSTRSLIWRFLLKLPENRSGYEALLDQGLHPSFRDFREKFPLKSDRKANSMEKILSCLAFWSPIFETLEYLPAIVFPFLSVFSNDMFSGFEAIMTVIINWCQKWWEYYPNPPIDCLDMLEDMLAFHDSELLAHFVSHKVTSQHYAWAMMQSLFSDLFSKPDWLKLWDHLLSQPPSFMYFFILAYILEFRGALLETDKLADFKYFFKRLNAANLTRILQRAYDLQSSTPSSLSPSTFLAPFTPCPRGEYPVFNKYPDFIVNYQIRMKEKIREEEEDYLRKRRAADELLQLGEELRKDKKAWELSDWKTEQMIERWWEQMMGEEQLRASSKAKLDAVEKERRTLAMRQIAEARSAFLEKQSDNTERHVAKIARSVGQTRRAQEKMVGQEDLDKAFKGMQDEWLKRREEMIQTRKELAKAQEDSIRRLVNRTGNLDLERAELQT